jgi:hypothetical protein
MNHCGKTGCFCTHTEPCEYGFIWVEYYEDKKTVTKDGNTKVVAERFEGVKFCPTCDPERSGIQNSSRNPTELGERLRARSKVSKFKTYEEEERSKTRAL